MSPDMILLGDSVPIIGGWCLTVEQMDAVMDRYIDPRLEVAKHQLIAEQVVEGAYEDILKKDYQILHCTTAPDDRGDEVSKEYYVFPVTADNIATARVQHTADGMEISNLAQPSPDTMAKLRGLLKVEENDDISVFAARFAALTLTATFEECETIIGHLATDLGKDRKDIAFKLFHEPYAMEKWESACRAAKGNGLDEYQRAKVPQTGQPPKASEFK